MISTQQIHYILQLYETKNFSKAADACFVTQPTLSMQIKKAEEVLGFLLFDRNRSPLQLTTMGNALLPIIKEMNVLNAAIVQLSKRANGTYIEELTIGIIPTIAPYLIPMLYPTWKKQLKQTRLIIKECKTEEILVQLENKQLDFGIIAGPLLETKWNTTPLYMEELLAYTKDRFKNGIKTNQLSIQKPWLLNKGNCLRSQMMEFCTLSSAAATNDWDFEGGNIELLIKMVDINGGYTLVPNYYKPLLSNGNGEFNKITDSATNNSPVRAIIGVQSNRNTKNITIQKIINSIEQLLNKPIKTNFNVINWK